ncbi:MAG: cell division protein FtsZ [Alphaproteobacteria bacterium]
MSIKLSVPEKNLQHLKPRISVIGVGGGGGNAVNNMIEQNLEGVDFIVSNTDAQALAHSKATRKIQLGAETTKGLGAGARPEIGKQAALEAQEEIERELEGSNMVFITAGMGGGTGSGAAPEVARIAKAKGILTVGVVTKPFQFEGKKRFETAETAVENFTKEVDSIIIIPNQNLFRVADKKTTLQDAFVMADNVLYDGVRSITDLMMMPGLINLDFADIKSIMEDKGKAIMGTGEAEGEDRAIKAAELALANPLLDDCSMRGAKGVLINITGGSDITLFEIDEAATRIKEEVDEDANIIFGSSYDDSLEGKIRVSIVATGIGDNPQTRIAQKKIIEEKYIPQDISTEISDENLEANLEKFAAIKEKEEVEEILEVVEEIIEEEVLTTKENTQNFIDYDLIEKSQIIEEMPKAHELFNAIQNNIAEENEEEMANNDEEIFVSTTKTVQVEEEPELFPNHNPHANLFGQRIEEEAEELIQTEPRRPTLIERVTGFSIAKKNKAKERKEEPLFQEAVPMSFASNDDDFNESKINLEIPSFLRRK